MLKKQNFFTKAIYLLCLLPILFSCGGSDTVIEKKKERSDGKIEMNLGCKFTDETFSAVCEKGYCPDIKTEIVCSSPDIAELVQDREEVIKDWNKNGTFDKRKGKAAIFRLKVKDKNGKKLKTRLDRGGGVIFLKDIKEESLAKIKEGEWIYGVGTITNYSAGWLYDDLTLSKVQILSEKSTQKLKKLVKVGTLARRFRENPDKLNSAEVRTLYTFIQDISKSGYDLDQQKAFAYFSGQTPETVEPVLKKALFGQLEENVLSRYEALATPFHEGTHDSRKEFEAKYSFALPTKSKCGKKPDVKNEAQKKRLIKDKSKIKKVITTKIYKIPLIVEPGEFNEETSEQPSKVHHVYGDIYFGKKPSYKVESGAEKECCDVFGNCTVRLLGCKKGERKKVVGYYKDYNWKDDGLRVDVVMKPKRAHSNSRGLEANAFIQLESTTRICAKNESQDPKYKAKLLAVHIKEKKTGKEVLFEDYFKLSAADAAKGKDAWLKEQIEAK